MDSVRDDIKALQIEVEWFFVCFLPSLKYCRITEREITPEASFRLVTHFWVLLVTSGKSLSQKDKSEKWMVWLPKANVAQVDYYTVQSMRVSDENSHPKTM